MSRVRVFNQTLLEGLVVDDASEASPDKDGARAPDDPIILSRAARERQLQRQKLKDQEDLRQRRYDRNRRDAAAKAAESDRKVREAINMHGVRREDRFQRHYSSIMEGKGLVSQIKKQQDLEDEAERNKKVRQFEEWNQNVYGKIQGRVTEQLDATTPAQLTRRRNVEFQKFLDTTNSKGAIFRDIIIESEYDPLEPNRNSIKVRSSDLVDPVSRVLDKNNEEKYMLAGKAAVAAAKHSHTREVLEVTDWGSGRIESTPHGFFAKMMAKKDIPPKPVSGTFKSVIPMDHYAVAKGTKHVDAEFPKGKRTRPQVNGPYHGPY